VSAPFDAADALRGWLTVNGPIPDDVDFSVLERAVGEASEQVDHPLSEDEINEVVEKTITAARIASASP
jgi:hypothetical protein